MEYQDKAIARLIGYRVEEVVDALIHITRNHFDWDMDVTEGYVVIFKPQSGPEPDPVIWEYDLTQGIAGLESDLLQTIGSYIHAFDMSAPRKE